MRNAPVNILVFLLSVLLFAYVGYQAQDFFSEPYTTETVMEYSISDAVTLTGLYIREESAIDEQTRGAMLYPYGDSVSVRAGEAVAYSFTSDEDIVIKSEINKLTNEINKLSQIDEESLPGATDSSQLYNRIFSDLSEMKYMADSSLLKEIDTIKSDINALLTQKSVFSGGCEELYLTLERYEAEIDMLEESLNAPQFTYYSPSKGNFTSYTDGLENELTPDDVYNMTVDEIKKYTENPLNQDESTVGKLVTDHNWFILSPIVKEERFKFNVGSVVEIDFPKDDVYEIPVVISDIIKDENDMEYVVFTCNYINSALLDERVGELKVHLDTDTGLRISNEAIRYVDGVMGVYVISEMQVEFKPIEIIYSGNSFSLVSQTGTGQNLLRRFDEVIIAGEDLYDGKQL